MFSSESLTKRWTYLLIHQPPYVFSLAIVHLGYVGNAFATCVELVPGSHEGRVLFDRSWFTLPLVGVTLTGNADVPFYSGFTAPGVLLELQGQRPDEPVRATVEAHGLALSAEIAWKSRLEPLRVESSLYGKPSKGNIVTTKQVFMPMEGSLQIEGHAPISLRGAQAGVDISYGFVPRHTRWHWSFAMGAEPQQNLPLAWNFCSGNNLGGALENALWWRGKKIALPRLEFLNPATGGLTPWKIQGAGAEARVSLEFQPAAEHREQVNVLGLVKSRFRQMTGRYQGTIEISGEKIAVDHFPGIFEDQDSLW